MKSADQTTKQLAVRVEKLVRKKNFLNELDYETKKDGCLQMT